MSAFFLDANIVAYFKTQAGGRGYQTLINEALKENIRHQDIETILRRVIREELHAPSLFVFGFRHFLLSESAFSKHGQVKGFFNREFIKTGVFAKDFGKLFNTVFEYRQKFDYVDLITPEEELNLYVTVILIRPVC